MGGPAGLALTPGLVHVVLFDLRTLADEGYALALLDPQERQRAARFRFSEARRRFITAHAYLRLLLGHLLELRPEAIRFRYGEHGKPEVANGFTDLRFNMAHSADRMILALSRRRTVGVDLERERPVAMAEISAAFFSPREQIALARTPPEERRSAFFRCWTRKESFVKALGTGLHSPLQEFTVGFERAGAQLLLECAATPAHLARWTIVSLPVASGFAAALTARGMGWAVHRWQCVARDGELHFRNDP